MRTTFELKLPVKYYDQDIIIFGNLYQALHDQEKIALLLLSAKIEPSHTEQIFKTTNVPESCLCSDVRQFHRKRPIMLITMKVSANVAGLCIPNV